jgi:hypothetical protein
VGDGGKVGATVATNPDWPLFSTIAVENGGDSEMEVGGMHPVRNNAPVRNKTDKDDKIRTYL